MEFVPIVFKIFSERKPTLANRAIVRRAALVLHQFSKVFPPSMSDARWITPTIIRHSPGEP
jgi:hypothetical protein